MNKIYVIGFSATTLGRVSPSGAIPDAWFQWHVEEGVQSSDEGPGHRTTLARIEVLDFKQMNIMREWARTALDRGATPLLLLGEGEPAPDFGPENDLGMPWLGEVEVMSIFSPMDGPLGQEFRFSEEDACRLLSEPDPDYLSYWAMLGASLDREALWFPFTIDAAVVDAYVRGLRVWRDVVHIAGRSEVLLSAWEGEVLNVEDISTLPRWIQGVETYELQGHPGVGLQLREGKWSSNGLLPAIEQVDPQNRIRQRLEGDRRSFEAFMKASVAISKARQSKVAKGTEHAQEGRFDSQQPPSWGLELFEGKGLNAWRLSLEVKGLVDRMKCFLQWPISRELTKLDFVEIGFNYINKASGDEVQKRIEIGLSAREQVMVAQAKQNGWLFECGVDALLLNNADEFSFAGMQISMSRRGGDSDD